MNFHKILVILIVGFSFLMSKVYAQNRDNILWSSYQLTHDLSEKWRIAFKPILRLNEDLGAYENFSIDLSAKYRIKPSTSFTLLSRTWFIPNDGDRQFIWLEGDHRWTLPHVYFNNKLRWHWALDINREDADFIRYIPTIIFRNLGKWKPQLGVDVFYRFNDLNHVQRIRYRAGVGYGFSNWVFKIIYWNEYFLEPEQFYDNILVTTISYHIKKKIER